MRRTECYGYAGNKPDFEWPTPNDLLQMSKNIAIKIQALKYKICSKDKEVFGAFQVILSNGTSSPVLAAKGEND